MSTSTFPNIDNAIGGEVTAERLLNHPYRTWSVEEKEYLKSLIKPASSEASVATSVAEPEIQSPDTAAVAVKKTLPLIPDMHVEDEPAPSETRYNLFTLYDANILAHREQVNHRIEYNGFYFLKGTVKPSREAEYDAYFQKNDRLPIGVVPFGEGIHSAYIPVVGSTNLEEAKWLNRANALRLGANYDDALYAEWPDLVAPAGELKPVQKFDPAWLPDVLRPYVVDISERMPVATDFPSICGLTCLSGAVGHRAFVFPREFDKGFTEPLNLSGAVIADSGQKKTPTWKMCMAPLVEWERNQDHIYEQRMAEYMVKLGEIDKLKRPVDEYNREEKKTAKKEKRDPIYRKYEDLPPTPFEPTKPRRLVVNDSTPEQLHEIAKVNEQGIFYFRDELSGWAAELDMIGRESARSMFLSGMTGDHDHNVDRIGREGGYAKVTLSVFGSFQPHMFINFLSEARNIADGTTPRFTLLSWPDRVRRALIDRGVNEVAKAQYRAVVRRLADLGDKSVELHFDKEAQQIFNAFRKELDHKVFFEPDPGKQSHMNKYEGGLAKIAALLQLVDTVASLPETPKLTSVNLNGDKTEATPTLVVPREIRIDTDHLQRALNILGYLESHMHRVYGSKLEGIEYLKVRLVEHIKDGSISDGMTARDIHVKDWAGLGRSATTADSIESALEELVELGWVRLAPQESNPRPGRPTKRWNVNPAARLMGLIDNSKEGE